MQGNRLLSALDRPIYRQIIEACDEVELCTGDILWEPQQRISHVYFPIDGSISQLMPIDARAKLELALVGNEGMLGAPLVLGVSTSTLQALVNGSGTAHRMNAVSFSRSLDKIPSLRRQLNRYIYVLQAQLALSAACVSYHRLDLRLARLLLMTHDRAIGLDSFHVTHQILAQMLGVRRVGVTNAAGLLQKRKLLEYNRGKITILNRTGLEKASCDCYKASNSVYASVLE